MYYSVFLLLVSCSLTTSSSPFTIASDLSSRNSAPLLLSIRLLAVQPELLTPTITMPNSGYQERQYAAHLTAAISDLAEGADALAHEREHRFESPPPPYPSSRTNTPPDYNPSRHPQPDPVKEVRALAKAHNIGKPAPMFYRESKRELKRLGDQHSEQREGRKQTLPWDDRLSYSHNADNNVRARWIEQGIWRNEWGPAWPIGPPTMEGGICTDKGPRPEGSWTHELTPTSTPHTAVTSTSRNRRAALPGIRSEEGSGLSLEPESLPVDRDASRPHRQFSFQVSKEREWLEDEYKHKREEPPMDLYDIALRNMKKVWQDDGTWDSRWDNWPGQTWRHEEPNPEYFNHPYFHEVYAPPDVPERTATERTDSTQPTRSTRIFGLFGRPVQHSSSPSSPAGQENNEAEHIEPPARRNGAAKKRSRDQSDDLDIDQGTAPVQPRRRAKRQATQTRTIARANASPKHTDPLPSSSERDKTAPRRGRKPACDKPIPRGKRKQASEGQPLRRSPRVAAIARVNYKV